MDLRYTPEELAFRDEVRAFFKSALPENIRRKMVFGQRISRDDLVTWHRILDAKGWVAPQWDPAWGGTGWDAVRLFIFKEELQQAPAPDPLGQNINLIGPVLIAFGTEEQKLHFLPRIRNLDYWFCQGFSEPGSGSDLASLKTRAVLDGDHYVINGQKVWTSGAHKSDWMFALVRTDVNARKQKGITYLLIDMKTPGITVRPIITLDGDHYTNEVFFDNVRVPVANRIGEENRGWDYAKFLLGNERAGVARVGQSKARVRRTKELAALVMTRDGPLADNARFRERLAAIEVELKALEITNMRVVADMKKNTGTGQDPKASILKLKGSELQQATTEALLEVAGPLGTPTQTAYMLAEGGEAGRNTVGPEWAANAFPNYFYNRSASIYGGTGEVQRNIVAKAILGL